MKKITLLLGAAFIMGTAAFAGDGHKDGCCKGKKETCGKEKKEAHAKGGSCCKKGEAKTTSASSEVKKTTPTKETKTTTAASNKM